MSLATVLGVIMELYRAAECVIWWRTHSVESDLFLPADTHLTYTHLSVLYKAKFLNNAILIMCLYLRYPLWQLQWITNTKCCLSKHVILQSHWGIKKNYGRPWYFGPKFSFMVCAIQGRLYTFLTILTILKCTFVATLSYPQQRNDLFIYYGICIRQSV